MARELIEELREQALDDEYPEVARLHLRAADEIERLSTIAALLEADRDDYARNALIGIAGLVPTPERGYVADGGPTQLRADLRALRSYVVDLESRCDRLKASLMAVEVRVSSLLPGPGRE